MRGHAMVYLRFVVEGCLRREVIVRMEEGVKFNFFPR